MSGRLCQNMDRAQTHTSTTLLGRVADGGDEAADGTFVRRYGELIRAVALSAGLSAEDVEDLTQEVLMVAVDALRTNRYDRSQGRFKPWLKGVVYNKVCDLRRRMVRSGAGGAAVGASSGVGHSATSNGYHEAGVALMRDAAAGRGMSHGVNIAALESIPDPSPPPNALFEDAFEKEWHKVAMEDALDQIRREVDPQTFQAFDLYALKEQPASEVAKLLGMSRNAVYIAKTRILARVRDKLSAQEAGEGEAG